MTETGQISSSLGGETVFTLNRAAAERRLEALAVQRETGDDHVREALDAARHLSGYREPGPVAEPVYAGRYERDGYAVEKYFVEGEGAYVIPYLLMVPEGPGPFPAVLYLHPDGKAADAGVGGKIEALVRQGFVVLAPDLVGTGETGLGQIERDLYRLPMGDAAYNVWFAAVQVGRSVVGLRAGDVVRLGRVLARRDDVDGEDVGGVARGEMGAVLLHAAAFDASISRTVLIDPLLSYGSFVTSEMYLPRFVHATVPGALTAYDLPDLAAAIAPRPLTLVGATGAGGEPVDPPGVEAAYGGQPRILAADDDADLGSLLRR